MKEEINLLTEILQQQGPEFQKKTAIIFTCVCELDVEDNNQEKISIEKYISKDKTLMRLIKDHSLKIFSVDNIFWDDRKKIDFIRSFISWINQVPNLSGTFSVPWWNSTCKSARKCKRWTLIEYPKRLDKTQIYGDYRAFRWKWHR